MLPIAITAFVRPSTAERTMQPIPETIEMMDIDRRIHSAPARLQSSTLSPRPTLPLRAATITPSLDSRAEDHARTRRSSSSTYLHPGPSASHVSRRPQRLATQHSSDHSTTSRTSHPPSVNSNSTSSGNNSSIPLRSIPSTPSSQRLTPPHDPIMRAGSTPSTRRERWSPPGVSAIEPRNLEASTEASQQNGKKQKGWFTRWWHWFLEIWFGWEDGEVYYGPPRYRVVRG